MKNSERPGFLISAVLGEGKPAWRGFDEVVEGWLPLLPEVELPPLTGADLAEVVRQDCYCCGFYGWGWKELKALRVSWFDKLARVLTVVQEEGVWSDGLLDSFLS